MPTFYSANPEFKVRVNKAGIEVDNMKVDSKVPKKDKIISKKQTEDEEKSAKDRASKILLEGGEINALDAKQIEIDSTEIGKFFLQLDYIWSVNLQIALWFWVSNQVLTCVGSKCVASMMINNICHYLSDFDDR